jgi:hypothetical protein
MALCDLKTSRESSLIGSDHICCIVHVVADYPNVDDKNHFVHSEVTITETKWAQISDDELFLLLKDKKMIVTPEHIGISAKCAVICTSIFIDAGIVNDSANSMIRMIGLMNSNFKIECKGFDTQKVFGLML